MAVKAHKSSIFDFNANIMALIAYIGGAVIGLSGETRYFAFIIPLVIYCLEKNSTFVKKNAIYATTLNILAVVIYIILGIIQLITTPKYAWSWNVMNYELMSGSPFINEFASVITWIIAATVAIISVLIMTKTYKYEEYEISFVSEISLKVETLLNKIYDNCKKGKVKLAKKVNEKSDTKK